MQKKEQYIQFAKDNDFALEDSIDIHEIIYDEICEYSIILTNGKGITAVWNIEKLIMKKEFIEAIARGIWKQGDTSFRKDKIGCKKILGYWYKKEGVIDYITHVQAIAIRDDKLDKFITKLGICNAVKNKNTQ